MYYHSLLGENDLWHSLPAQWVYLGEHLMMRWQGQFALLASHLSVPFRMLLLITESLLQCHSKHSWSRSSSSIPFPLDLMIWRPIPFHRQFKDIFLLLFPQPCCISTPRILWDIVSSWSHVRRCSLHSVAASALERSIQRICIQKLTEDLRALKQEAEICPAF